MGEIEKSVFFGKKADTIERKKKAPRPRIMTLPLKIEFDHKTNVILNYLMSCDCLLTFEVTKGPSNGSAFLPKIFVKNKMTILTLKTIHRGHQYVAENTEITISLHFSFVKQNLAPLSSPFDLIFFNFFIFPQFLHLRPHTTLHIYLKYS